MKKTLFFVASISLLCACGKTEQDAPEYAEGVACELAIGLPETSSKTILGAKDGNAYPILWSKGDIVSVNGILSYGLSSAYKGTQSAIFKFKDTPEAPLNFAYPGVEGFADKVVFPSVQEYLEGSFAEGSCPMYASSAVVGGVEMAPLGSVIRFNLFGSTKITKVVITAPGGEPLSGEFKLGKTDGLFDGTISSYTETSTTNSVTLDVPNGIALNDITEASFNVLIPAGEYSEYLLGDVYDEDGIVMRYEFLPGKDNKVLPGKVYTFSPRQFSGQLFITNIEEFMAFAKSSNSDDALLLTDIDLSNQPEFKAINNYAGCFDGGNHKITGLTSPLFGSFYGICRNLSLDAHIDYNGTNAANDSGTDYGVGILCHYAYISSREDAAIENVTVSGSIAITGKTKSAHAFQIGGLAGASNGVPFTNCVNKASVTIGENYSVAASTTSTAFTTAIGGIVGTAQTATTSVFTNCVNEGRITCEAKGIGETLYAGGVIGYHNRAAVVESCVNKGTVTITETTYSAKASYLGGVVGYNAAAVKNCTNEGNLLYMGECKTNVQVGGVVGYNNNANCGNLVNRGEVRAENLKCTYLFIGGVMAFSNAKTLSDLENYGDVSVSGIKNSAGTGLAIGGVIGQSAGQTHTTSRFYNYGSVTVEPFDDGATAGRYDVGGIVGYEYFDTSGKLAEFNVSDFHNEGNVTVENISTTNALRVGGICGNVLCGAAATNSVFTSENLSNKGSVFITGGEPQASQIGGVFGDMRVGGTLSVGNATNDGDILITGFIGSNSTTGGLAIGGICARIADRVNGATVTNCTNNGKIGLYEHETDSYFPSAGGIIGQAYSSSSRNLKLTVTDCTNNGNIERTLTGVDPESLVRYKTDADGYMYNSTAAGIVATIGSYTATSLVLQNATIENCVNTGSIQFNRKPSLDATNAVEVNNGDNCVWTGGIVGMAWSDTGYSTTIKCCSNSGHIASSAGKIGGIIGFARNNVTVTGTKDSYCVNSGLVGQQSANATGTPLGYAGGIVGYLFGSGTSGIEYCYNKAGVSCNYGAGGLVGQVGSGSSKEIKFIRNCKSFADFRASSSANQTTICFGRVDGGEASLANVSNVAVGGRVYWKSGDNWTWYTSDASNYKSYLVSPGSSAANIDAVTAAAASGKIVWWDGVSPTAWE